jgi:hypothetical protein
MVVRGSGKADDRREIRAEIFSGFHAMTFAQTEMPNRSLNRPETNLG